MKNHYLHIYIDDDGKITISSSDGVFGSIATIESKEAFQAYCEEKAHEWICSKYKNYDDWSKEDRRTIAHKWLAAKELSDGKYEYYFNLQSVQDIFREEVDFLAKSMGITYTLTVE